MHGAAKRNASMLLHLAAFAAAVRFVSRSGAAGSLCCLAFPVILRQAGTPDGAVSASAAAAAAAPAAPAVLPRPKHFPEGGGPEANSGGGSLGGVDGGHSSDGCHSNILLTVGVHAQLMTACCWLL